MPLKIAAKVDPYDAKYFNEIIKPLLDDALIEFIGEVGDSGKAEFLGNASALLFPIDWPEPFGLVMIEAMSAGTPVIAWRNGSVPEVITPGRSGFIVESIDDAVAAVPQALALDRRTVRAEFEKRFTLQHMAARYISVYEEMLQHASPSRNGTGFSNGRPRPVNGTPASVAIRA
jgi:glycosyltransferase involved in cell wall biosynthesis